MPEEYSQKEENTFRKDLFRRLDNQDGMLNDIKEQTTKHNGRMTKLETRTEDYDDYKKTVQGLSGFKMWLTGAVVASLTVGSGIAYLFMEKIENNTRQIVSEMIEQEKPKIIKSAVEDIITVINQEYNLKIR